MMRRLRLLIQAACLVAACRAGQAGADGGQLRESRTVGGVRVTMFTEPTPLRAGPCDVSVLVQDADTGAVLTGATVRVALARQGDDTPRRAAVASRRLATNKLYQAAHFDLPSAGPWRATIAVAHAAADVQFDIDLSVEERLPRLVEMGFWIGLPVVPIALFGLREWRARRAARGAC